MTMSGVKHKFPSYEERKARKKLKQDKFIKRIFEEKKEETPDVDFTVVKKMKTISIAVPGSILLNAQSRELQTYLAGQIARAATIFMIDEVIVYDDDASAPVDGGLPVDDKKWDACLKLARILQYLECPQYLRKFLFPVHNHLSSAGLLNPLDAPHHYRIDDDSPYREGIITSKKAKEGKGSYANVGLYREVRVDKALVPGVRVTVKMLPQEEGSKKLKGILVPPSMPKADLGLYWGYNVRIAKSLSKVFTESSYDSGYDLSIGTSDSGQPLKEFRPRSFSHCLIVFGGLKGIEYALENDESIDVQEVTSLFDYYLNTCPNQGTRTIRTEEAILISLSKLVDIL